MKFHFLFRTAFYDVFFMGLICVIKAQQIFIHVGENPDLLNLLIGIYSAVIIDNQFEILRFTFECARTA